MDLRTYLCLALSRKLMRPAPQKTVDYATYGLWRHNVLSKTWEQFSDADIHGREVLDFGCGDGQLSLFLAQTRHPKRIVGVDLAPAPIARARSAAEQATLPADVEIEYIAGAAGAIPVPDQSFDTLLAFDCLEHVMTPSAIIGEWFRVLRPGGRALVNWYPYKGPWGPHMESLIPIPWAHILFGERAMLRAAEKIYDSPEFEPRHWDLDAEGKKKPNKWKAWSSFDEQGYINKLTVPDFRRLAQEAGFRIDRFDVRSFGGSPLRRGLGRALMNTPGIGEYFMSYIVIELVRA